VKKFLIPIGSFAALGLLLAYALSQMQSGELSPRKIPSPLIGKPGTARANTTSIRQGFKGASLLGQCVGVVVRRLQD